MKGVNVPYFTVTFNRCSELLSLWAQVYITQLKNIGNQGLPPQLTFMGVRLD